VDARRDWEHPPKYCKRCKDKHDKREVACRECGKSFVLSTSLQLKCAKNGWELPTRCQECRNDALLIKGAIGAARDQFGFPIDVEIAPKGIIFPQKVAVIKNRKTGEKVAEIRMREDGIFLTERVAITTNTQSNKVVSKTRDEKKGIIFTERAAKTYQTSDGKRTHETTNKERGLFLKEKFAETENLTTGNKSVTKDVKKGFFFTKWFVKSDKG
jgi:predicted RNA-binding Zn-ribbon protein involved in translation (DUF1610 family)